MMTGPFEFSDLPKGHFMSLAKRLMNTLRNLWIMLGCFTL